MGSRPGLLHAQEQGRGAAAMMRHILIATIALSLFTGASVYLPWPVRLVL